MLQHKDLLVDLNSHNSVSGKIRSLHKVMKEHKSRNATNETPNLGGGNKPVANCL